MFFSGESRLGMPCERFGVVYKLWGDEKEAMAKAKDICFEQTVEFPEELVPQGIISDNIVGRIESFEAEGSDTFRAEISFPVEGAAGELTQLLNMVFGNISLKPGIRVEELRLSEGILKNFKGPRFGIDGIRELLGVEKRPLLFTALKPMGLTNEEFSELAYKFALGGIDLIKDDHGLSNQPFSSFEERIRLCTAAVDRANRETGLKCKYIPNVTAPSGEVIKRARLARHIGAGGLLISPGLVGLDAMREVAEDDSVGLPIFAHPAFQGTYVIGQSGISHQVLFGQLARLAGADGTIYPNFGGRFSFSKEECEKIAAYSTMEMGAIKPIFPCPAGGMSLQSIPESLKVYGDDVIFLVGGGLFKHGPDIAENSRYFKGLIEKLSGVNE